MRRSSFRKNEWGPFHYVQDDDDDKYAKMKSEGRRLLVGLFSAFILLTVFFNAMAKTSDGHSLAAKSIAEFHTEDETNNRMFTGFTEKCYMVDELDEDKPSKYQNFYASDDADEDEDSSEEDTDDDWAQGPRYPDYSIGRPDQLHLGRCRHDYHEQYPPPKGYLEDIDFFFWRQDWIERDRCFLYCLTRLPKAEITTDLLVDAVRMGLPGVTRTLVHHHGLNPLAAPSKGTKFYPRSGLNAVQEAIRGGHAQVLSILTGNNHSLVIDPFGRTVKDYVSMRGSPIRPKHAQQFLGLDTTASQRTIRQNLKHRSLGWNSTKSKQADNRCDLEIVDSISSEVFFKDFYLPGRPFVLRNVVPGQELQTFSKTRWSKTKYYHPTTQVRISAQGKPSLTGQRYCPVLRTIGDINEGRGFCPTKPGIPHFRSSDIPDDDHYKELFPLYDGDNFHPKGGWRILGELFGDNYKDSKPDFYLFIGGDESGPSFHAHKDAFNILYVGLKQWRIVPPLYKGITAIHSNRAQHMLNKDAILRCTQGSGDMIYLPDQWGHLIVSSGFTIGTATIAAQPLDRMIPRDGKSWASRMWSREVS